MYIKVVYNIGDTVWYVTDNNLISSFIIRSTEINVTETGIHIIYNGLDKYLHYNEDRLFASKEQCKNYLVKKIQEL